MLETPSILQRTQVARILAHLLGFEQTAHNFAAARLRQLVHESHRARRGEAEQLIRDNWGVVESPAAGISRSSATERAPSKR